MNSKDSLGDRMKSQYEDRYRIMLPRRTYTIIRLDGKNFHTFTRNAVRPFDFEFTKAMDRTAEYLASEAQGCQFVYTQSDEISLLLTDFETPQTAAWFDGNLQKIVSVIAGLSSAKFGEIARKFSWFPDSAPSFDARAFIIPDPVEVENYFIWRQKDASRNSINQVAQHFFPHSELQNKNISKVQEMLILKKGYNWDTDTPTGLRNGRAITYWGRLGESCRWHADPETPEFTKNRSYLISKIPIQWGGDPL